MIIIRAGHILTSVTSGSYTLKEVAELKLRAADLDVSSTCLEVFLNAGDSNASPTVHLVARHYRHRNHHTLLCAGGFVGKCTGETVLPISSDNLGSAGGRMPPELFAHLARCFKSMYGFEPQEATQFSKLSLVCKYWAQLYRPMQWRLASFRSPDRLDPFLSILNSTPNGLPSVAAFIVRVVVIAIGIPDQPWIHLIPLRLKRHLFSRKHPDRLPSFSLSIVLRTNGLPSASDKRVYMPATHDCLPKSLSLFNFQCQTVELTGVDFRTFEQFMVSVRAFRKLEGLSCTKVGWTTDPPERLVLLRTFAYPPLRRAMVQPFEANGGFNVPHKPESHWVSALWCWARRRAVDGKHYLLEDHETMMVMKITSLFQGFWRRKSTPTLEMFVKERRRRDHHGEPLDVEGFDVCFAIDRRGYTFVFTLTADLSLTTPPDEARIRDDYYALHVQCITICCTIATHSDLGLGNLVDHAKFWKQVMELPFASLRNVVVAFARNTEGEVLQKTLQEHAPRLLNPGTRDTVARKLVIVQSDQDPPEEGCKWMKLNPATFEAKGPSCAWYDENDLRSPDNIHGLSRILV